MDKVSVIIPTYNRFKYLLNAIQSIKAQTYKNVEIIVINDCSTQPEYYNHDWNVTIIHLKQNSKEIMGFACAAFVRNAGIEVATGKYIAFCDDDDIWFSNKLELQIAAMLKTGCKMSSTEGIIGNGAYDRKKSYSKYNSECFYNTLLPIYARHGYTLFPDVWTFKFIKIHNCVICSSVVIEKELLNSIGNMKCVSNGKEDYDCWLKALMHTNSVYIKDVCFYYDGNHGDGQNY